MIITEIDESIERLKLGRSVEDAQALKKDLDTLYDRLKSKEPAIRSYLKDATETQAALGTTVDKKKYLISSLKRFCSDSLNGDRDSAIQELNSIDSNVNDGKVELKSLWSEYRADNYTASAKLIEALLNVMYEDERLDELGDLRLRIEEKSIGNKSTVSDIDAFKKLTDALIKSMKMKPEILDFINKLAENKSVLISQITSEVYEWIKENKLDKKIFLSLNVR
jgi:hypothetical protein